MSIVHLKPFMKNVLLIRSIIFLINLQVSFVKAVKFHFMKGYSHMNSLHYFLLNLLNMVSETPLLLVLLVAIMGTLLVLLSLFKKFFNSRITVKEISSISQSLLEIFLTTISKNSSNQLPMEPLNGESQTLSTPSLLEEKEEKKVQEEKEEASLDFLELKNLIQQIKEVINNEKH